MRIHISETAIPCKDGVELWRVLGLPHLYPTKICAEVAVRVAFPHEDADKRYARISYVRYRREE